VTVSQTLNSIIVSPSAVSLNESGTQQFTATAKDQFGASLSSQPAFTWSAGGGMVDSSGLYTAPFASGTFLVTAASGAISNGATASVTLLPGDTDGDGQRTVADVGTLMTALTDMTAYQSSYSVSPNDAMTVGNLDGDSAVTNLDLQAMIVLLANAAGASAPASASSAPAAFATAASTGTTSDSQVLPNDSIALRTLSTEIPDQELLTTLGQVLPANTIRSVSESGTTAVLITAGPSAGSSSDDDRVSNQAAVILSRFEDTDRPVADVQPLNADHPSVPRLATRNHLYEILARDEIFLDWPSMATS
jgi:hypothetical protein